jgi:hypothetical protein
VGASEGHASHTEYWLQKWIAIAESIGIPKRALLDDYFFDEFLTVLDAYNEMHSVSKDDEVEEVDAENW